MRAVHGLILLLAATAAAAQERFPQRPVRVLVGLAPGSGSDVVARLIAPRLAEQWGQGVVIDNRSGAGGLLASEMLARATPDGHTLIMVGLPTHAFQGAYYRKLPFDAVRDFAGV